MTASLFDDAFAHHVWATDRLIDACTALTKDQLDARTPGTYGSIIGTLRHLVASDRWYLSFFAEGAGLAPIDEEAALGLEELRDAMATNGAAWTVLLAGAPDPEADVLEQDERWEFHAPLGFRLAQAIHHGSDHRSQVCTALTGLGLTPPEIDLWAYGEATDRTRAVPVTTP